MTPIRSTALTLAVLALGGCSAMTSSHSRQLRQVIAVNDADGKRLAALTPTSSGFRYEDATGAMGKLSYERERVKIQDAQGKRLAKAKRDPDGLSVDNGADQTVLMIRVRPDGWELKRGDDRPLGRIKADRLTLAEKGKVVVRPGEPQATVKRDGVVRALVTNTVPSRAALLLGLDELTFPERLLAMTAAAEWLPLRDETPPAAGTDTAP